MDQNENHHQIMYQTPTTTTTTTTNNNIRQYLYSHFLIIYKTTLLLLLSLLFLSFLLISYTVTSSPSPSPSPSPFPFFFFFSISSHYYNNFHFSPLLFPLFTLTINRKYVFLICNAILAFLANSYSSFTPPPPTAISDDDPIPEFDDFANQYDQDLNVKVSNDDQLSAPPPPPLLQLNESTTEEGILSLKNPTPAEKQEQETGYFDIEEEEESFTLITETEDKGRDTEYAVEEEGNSVDTKETYAEEETNEANVNADELNRKFEEFIRKMKKEIRIEAQRQLIAV